MNKKSFKWHGKKYYLLGADKDGINYYLEEATFDGEWYWGLGYVETFTNNISPNMSRDIRSHEYFDTMIFPPKCNCFETFKTQFPDNPFSDREIWTLCELLRSAYCARRYSDMIYLGGSHITNNLVGDTIKNDTEYDRINKFVIPQIMQEVYKIMEGEKKDA